MKLLENSQTTLVAGVVLLLGLMLGLAGTGAAEQPANFDEALQAAAELDQPLILDFYTDW